MSCRFSLALLLALSCAPLTAQDFYVSTTGDNGDAGTKAAPWRTVTFAATTATSGSRIHIDGGTYGTAGFLEGIELTGGKRLSFFGNADGQGPTVILANAAFAKPIPYRGGTRTWGGVFLAHGVGTTLNLTDLTVDGANINNSFHACVIYSDGAGGKVDFCELRNSGGNRNSAGGQVGLIAVGKGTASPSTVVVDHCHIHSWSKIGVVMAEDGLTGTISKCVIEGGGPLGPGKAAQNCIQLGSGGSGFTVRDNVIRDAWYTPSSWNAVGVLVYQGTGNTLIANNRILSCKTGVYHDSSGQTDVVGSNIANCQWGINFFTNGATARANHFDIEAGWGIYVGRFVTATLSGNSYSDFRGNPGFPTRYIAAGNPTVVDTTPVLASPGFARAVAVNAGAGTTALVTGDFDSDGKTDFATANLDSDTVTVRFGTGGTGFGRSDVIVVPGRPAFLATGEFSGRPGLDIAVLSLNGDVRVLANMAPGTGVFLAGDPFDIDGGSDDFEPTSIAAGQINGVDADDIVVGWAGNRTTNFGGVRVLHVKDSMISAGSFPAQHIRSVRGIALGQLDGDAPLDLAAVDVTNNRLQVWLGLSTFGFPRIPAPFPISVDGRGVAIGDLNDDGDADLAVTCASTPGLVHVFEGPCPLTEASRSPFRVEADAGHVAIVDLQNDDDFDTPRREVVVTHPALHKITVMRHYRDNGSGFGGFDDFRGCFTALAPEATAFANLNGGPLLDMLVAQRTDGNVTVSLDVPDARADLYGVGCAGEDDRVPEILATGSPCRPALGNGSFGIGVRRGRRNSIGVCLIALRQTPSATACDLQVDPLSIILFPVAGTDSTGSGNLPLGIPNDLSLLGGSIFAQWAVIDTQGRFFNIVSFSPGMAFRFGS